MKKLLVLFCGVFFVGSASSAGEIQNVITDSVQLTVNGSSSITTRQASSYSVSGTNIEVASGGSFGGLAAGSTAGAGVVVNDGTYGLTTDGQAFTFSESALVGEDTLDSMAIDATDGTLDTHNTYGQLTTLSGGTKGSLAGTLSPTGIATVTAGGQGTTALGQRTVTLSVFD